MPVKHDSHKDVKLQRDDQCATGEKARNTTPWSEGGVQLQKESLRAISECTSSVPKLRGTELYSCEFV